PPAAIAFDWGGIFTRGTFDSSAIADLSALIGASTDFVEPRYLNLMEEFETGVFDMEGFHRRFCDDTRSFPRFDRFKATFLGAVRERAPMYELAQSLDGRFKLGMLSNNVPVLCDTVRNDRRLQGFDAFLFSNEIGVRKPHPDAFALLAAALALPPEEIVFVDDNQANIAACLELGFRGLWLDDLPSFAARWRESLPGVALPEGFEEHDVP
ncbi:MAG TPA: HAD-IA family hydrolase, partial [Trueperaceae bacterium]|nr:HAD-IA family hydrolase [Trueperaceae bacterium]